MQLLFGVVGTGSRTSAVFEHLLDLSIDSNPGIQPTVDAAPGLIVGRHVRSWGRWDDPTGELTVLLDGEIRLIDGAETGTRGTSESELASVAALYRRLGSSVWDRLDGSFCLVIRDGRSVRIGFDLGGTHAVYWWAADGMVAFHTRLLDLAPAYPDNLRVDITGVASFLTNAFYALDATAFEGIHLVGSGQVLEIEPASDGPSVTMRNHFRFVPTPESPARPIGALADELNDLLEPAVARCWRTAVRPVVPLSGGVDSRYLAAMAVRLAGDPMQVETITWGEESMRPGSDAVIASRVAAALGVPHQWWEKRHIHDVSTVQRALYLTSGEGDGALNFPSEHEIHEQLVKERGWQSLFRGDELWGPVHHQLTRTGLRAAAGLSRIRLDRTYARFLGVDLLESMADGQDHVYGRWRAGLTAGTAHGQLHESEYDTGMRRVIVPYNTLKDVHFEVYAPFVQREVVDWVSRLPDSYKLGKRVFRVASERRFPELSTIPFASRNNLPDWDERARTDPALTRSLRELCDQPGWLDMIGAKASVVDALEALTAGASASMVRGDRQVASSSLSTQRRIGQMARDGARATLPGKLVREWTMERRAIGSRSMYDRLSRLAIVHALIGLGQARHAKSRQIGQPPPASAPGGADRGMTDSKVRVVSLVLTLCGVGSSLVEQVPALG